VLHHGWKEGAMSSFIMSPRSPRSTWAIRRLAALSALGFSLVGPPGMAQSDSTNQFNRASAVGQSNSNPSPNSNPTSNPNTSPNMNTGSVDGAASKVRPSTDSSTKKTPDRRAGRHLSKAKRHGHRTAKAAKAPRRSMDNDPSDGTFIPNRARELNSNNTES
jgi:hypothetical protein